MLRPLGDKNLNQALSSEWVERLVRSPAAGALLFSIGSDLGIELRRITEFADAVAHWPGMEAQAVYDSALSQIDRVCNV